MESEDADVDVEKDPEDNGHVGTSQPRATSTITMSEVKSNKPSTKTETVKTVLNSLMTGVKTGSPGHSTGSPAHHTGSPGHHTGSPSHHTGSPGHNIGSPGHKIGSPGHHIGSPGHHIGSPGHHIGSPGHHIGSPGHHLGSPGHYAGSPVHHTGSPGHNVGSPIHHIGSPSHHTGSPAHLTGSPGYLTGSPGHHKGSPGHRTESPGHHTGSPVHRKGSPGRVATPPAVTSSSYGLPHSPIMVSTPTKQHQKVFQPNKKRPVVVLRDIAGRPAVKRKRSPRRGDSPKRGQMRSRRVSLPMQHHPGYEPCVLAKAKVWLPIDVIEEPFIFNEVVSLDTWDKVLSPEDRDRLTELLPTFEDNDVKEKRETLKRLFAGDNFHFGNQVDFLHKKIQSGRLHPETIRADRLYFRQKRRDYKYRQQRRVHKLLKDVLISRQELLEAAQYTAPHEQIRVKKPRPKPAHQEFDRRVAKKYRKVLRDVKHECGARLDTSDEDETMYDIPEPAATPKTWLDILSDMYPAAQSVNSVQSTTAPKPTPYELGLADSPLLSPPATPAESPYKVTETDFISMIEKHERRRNEEEECLELDTKSIHLHDVVGRVYSLHRSPLPGSSPTFVAPRQPTVRKKKRKDKDKIKKKRKQKPPKTPSPPTPPATVRAQPKTSLVETPPSSIKPTNQKAPTTKVKIEMVTPAPAPATVVNQVTPPSPVMTSGFLVLIREMMTALPNQSMTLVELENRVSAWQRSPASLCCGWVTLEPNWAKVVGHVMRFLGGTVPTDVPVDPRVTFDVGTQMWRWIGHGKDSNEELVQLFKQWLGTVHTEGIVPVTTTTTITTTSQAESEPPAYPSDNRRLVVEPVNIPSPRMKTSYVVRPSTDEEKADFRIQEQRRYEQPHKAFTYNAHGYESVVGPVKGVFGKDSSLTKAREHTLLVNERPPYVTILSLVRDAVARLPNGEGTRSEVCELLKDSQFLSLSIDSHLNTVVSGALDRLHYEKDPCVKYDTTRKMWIYLHRNRNEEEFERLHKEFAAAAKAKKSTSRQPRPVTKMKSMHKESSLSPGATAHSETSNDSIPGGPRMETPSPTQSPVTIATRMLTPSPVANMMHTPGVHPSATAQIALSSPRAGLPVSKQTVQQHIGLLNARLLGSGLPVSGIQVTAVRTPTMDTMGSNQPHMLGGENKFDMSGTSLIKAQLLAPRVGQLPAGTQLNQYGNQPQVMLTAGAPRGQQISQEDIRNQLFAQSLARSLSLPGGIGLARPPMTSQPTSVSPQVQAQQFALSLAGARGEAPPNRPPTAADLLKHELGRQAGFQGVGTTIGSTPMNVTLTLKRAQSMEANLRNPRPQGPYNQPSIRMPTVGSLLAGLGMSPHSNTPIHTGRTPTKKKSRAKKSSSQALAGLALAQSASRAPQRHPVAFPSGVSPQVAATQSPQARLATPPGVLSSKEGQQSRGQVVTIQALTGPQMATPSPAAMTSLASASTAAALLANASLTHHGSSALQHQQQMASMIKTSGGKGPHISSTGMTFTPTGSTASSVPHVRVTTASLQAPAVRRPTQSKSQKISKMISSQPGRVPEVRYSIPTGRQNPSPAQHAAAIQSARLTLQSLTQQSSAAGQTSGKVSATHATAKPQTSKPSGVHVLGSLSKLEGSNKPGVTTIPMSLGSLSKLDGSKQGLTTIPMSLLLQGQAMASSGGLPKGAVLSSQLLGNIPVGVSAQGKGLIFQMPPGSKLVTAMPVSTTATAATTAAATNSKSASQSPATGTVTNPGKKPSVQSTATATAANTIANLGIKVSVPSTATTTSAAKTTSITNIHGNKPSIQFTTAKATATSTITTPGLKTSIHRTATAAATTTSGNKATLQLPATATIPGSKPSIQTSSSAVLSTITTSATRQKSSITIPMTTSSTLTTPAGLSKQQKVIITTKARTQTPGSQSCTEMGTKGKETTKQEAKSTVTTTASPNTTNA